VEKMTEKMERKETPMGSMARFSKFRSSRTARKKVHNRSPVVSSWKVTSKGSSIGIALSSR